MVRKGNLAVFESSNISETEEVTPTKIGVIYLAEDPSDPYSHTLYWYLGQLFNAIYIFPACTI